MPVCLMPVDARPPGNDLSVLASLLLTSSRDPPPTPAASSPSTTAGSEGSRETDAALAARAEDVASSRNMNESLIMAECFVYFVYLK